MRIILFCLLVAVACGAPATLPTDGHASDGPHVDGAPGGSGAVDTVTCQTHTFTQVNADGSKVVTDYNFALLDGVDPTAPYVLELCDYVIGGTKVYQPRDPMCPSGATCSDSGVAYPVPTHICTWTDSGEFFDGKLYVNCGNVQRTYNAAGTLTASSASGYAVVRVHH